MKTTGKVTLKGFTFPVKDSEPVVLEAIEIEYEANFGIHEVIKALDLIDVLPEKLAGAYRKFLAYQEEFGIQKPEESEATQNTEDMAEAIARDAVIKEMIKYDAETAVAEETER